jgi:hypothetical protein
MKTRNQDRRMAGHSLKIFQEAERSFDPLRKVIK